MENEEKDVQTTQTTQTTFTSDDIAKYQKQIDDLTAERDSLKSELSSKNTAFDEMKAELQKTKEMNFTLVRQTSVKQQSVEDIINDIF